MTGGNRANRVFEDPSQLVEGSWPTPLLRLRGLSRGGWEAWAKLEFFNPFSRSIKDRAVWFMIMDAVASGRLREGGALYEATSGNVGIAMASIANILGLRFRAYIPRHAPKATEAVLKVLGAEVVRLDRTCINEDVVGLVRREAEEDGATHLNQYVNESNFTAHLRSTARELDEQLASVGRSPPKAVVAGVGTSGHSAAVAKYFRVRYGPDAPEFVAVFPREGESIPGLRPASARPKWVGEVAPDRVVEVGLEEAVAAAVLVARTNGVFVGLSSGAVAAAYELVREEVGRGAYALIFPDDGFKYVEIFEAWLERRPDLLRRYADLINPSVCRE